jgi:hypothetical protein
MDAPFIYLAPGDETHSEPAPNLLGSDGLRLVRPTAQTPQDIFGIEHLRARRIVFVRRFAFCRESA